MDAETIKQAWLDVFPNSEATSRTILGTTCVSLRLFTTHECINQIPENDPLTYKIWIEKDGLRESKLHVLTQPPKDSNLVYSTENMRKQTIKNPDHDKLIRRFKKVRDWIAKQDMKHDITGKIEL